MSLVAVAAAPLNWVQLVASEPVLDSNPPFSNCAWYVTIVNTKAREITGRRATAGHRGETQDFCFDGVAGPRGANQQARQRGIAGEDRGSRTRNELRATCSGAVDAQTQNAFDHRTAAASVGVVFQ